MTEFSDYAWLVGAEGAAWLDRAAGDERGELALLAALRRDLSTERARLVAELTALRRRAVAKFGALAARMFFTRVQLEQATDLALARYKAARFEQAAAGAAVSDYCCGMGGDLLGLAGRGPVIGFDRSELALLFARANLDATLGAAPRGRADARLADVETISPEPGEAWHADPDRRAAGRRTTRVEAYAPGPAAIERWLAASPTGAVKLAPGGEAPAEWADAAELEWISSGGECRQAVAWFGNLAPGAGTRRATRLAPGEASAAGSLTGNPGGEIPAAAAAPPGAYLVDPDPAVLAADLLGALAARHGLDALAAGSAYLTGERAIDDPLATVLAVEEVLPLRLATIARHLAARRVGSVEIKKRGVAADPDAVRRRLKLHGSGAAVLVLTRIGRREVAIVAQRVSPPALREPPGIV